MDVSLDKDGYVIIRSALSKSIIKQGEDCFQGQKVNYLELEKVNAAYLNVINEKVGLNLKCIKYRASNNNNSTDAGMFHRDLRIYRGDTSVPVYTCLLYLDDANMELIPTSHKKTNMSFIESLFLLRHRKLLDIKKGDMIIFHASMIHRGIFFKPQPYRRLIQQFDCVPENMLAQLNQEILHTACQNKCNNRMGNLIYKLNKTSFSNIVNKINYLNVGMGYGLQLGVQNKFLPPNFKYISTESNQDRLKPKGGWEKNNLYVFYDLEQSQTIDTDNLGKFYFYSNTLYLILIMTIIILIIILIVCQIIYYYKLYRMLNYPPKKVKTNTRFKKLINNRNQKTNKNNVRRKQK